MIFVSCMDYRDARIADIYDLLNLLAEDGQFYLSLAGDRPISVLDLGCGTGTLACALAEHGHQVTGVDTAAAMLKRARSKPHAKKVEWVEVSAQSYRSDQRFDLIVMTGHAFQVLLTDDDVVAVLETMRIHLKQGGKAAFETRNPRVDWAREWNGRQRVVREVVETLQVTDSDEEFISFETTYQVGSRTLTTSSTLRFLAREKIQHLIGRSGLMVRDLFGDWEGGPFEAERSKEIIFVVQMARG
jgi:ubiquinone/menaquinone biosynthesis C-methylase UbiE